MKFRKPNTMNSVVRLDFLDSLPDEFEIVPEGHVCVKWPEGLTRDRLEYIASLHNPAGEIDVQLRSLAAIAPERKGRRVNLWERECKDYIERRWVYEGEVLNDKVWRKVAGPIEIDD